MIKCEKGNIDMQGMLTEIEAEVACILRAYFEECDKRRTPTNIESMITFAMMSDEGIEEEVARVRGGMR